MKKIYISGGIKNVPDFKKVFCEKEKILINQEWNVVNPVSIGDLLLINNHKLRELPEKELYKAYMREDLKELLLCDYIYMLKNWGQSKGARFEHETAIICGIDVVYE